MALVNKKVLVITSTDSMIWQFLIPHIKHMQELGNTVECVCSRTGFWFDELKDKHGFTMHEIDFARNPFKLRNIKGYKKLCALQEKCKFDVVYSQQPVGGLMGRLFGKKFKLPVIYTAHGFHFFKGCPIQNKLIYKPVEKWLSRYTDVLITINNEDYENAKKMKAKKVFKINGIGIDDNKLRTENFDKTEFREELGLGENDKVILTVSELNKNKNYITMLKTMKRLIEKDKSYKFVSCGTGVWTDKIHKFAEKLGIKDNCVFLGYRKDVGKIMQISNLFFHASHREGLTLSVMEAMNFGLPCVVSNVRGNRDLVVNGQGGFIVEPEDDENFTDKIHEVFNDNKLKENFSKFNREKSKEYTVEFVKKQLEEIYKEI